MPSCPESIFRPFSGEGWPHSGLVQARRVEYMRAARLPWAPVRLPAATDGRAEVRPACRAPLPSNREQRGAAPLTAGRRDVGRREDAVFEEGT
jgi:hypothetical protein